ncbi:MAG: 16S rRNA (guanine(966)-N(2))-methyltransferase RsmD [Elusimicrobia bacterium]|nr:16S rRNA (guanine(966)-N(2))-methyltransferase RsmD [Elusimicrobiota bacterium]
MRVIGGRLRGRRLPTGAKVEGLRPISGRIKQSLFDILKEVVGGARFLDLFAGTGAVGIEALSRGAAFACFVELARRAVENLERNLARAGLKDRSAALRGNACDDLSWVPFRSKTAQYDLVFTGPPYKDLAGRPLAYTAAALTRVMAADLLAPGGWIICQHQVKEPVGAVPGLEMFRRVKYGDSYLSFFKARPPAASGTPS